MSQYQGQQCLNAFGCQRDEFQRCQKFRSLVLMPQQHLVVVVVLDTLMPQQLNSQEKKINEIRVDSQLQD
jgi:hypothetical protein